MRADADEYYRGFRWVDSIEANELLDACGWCLQVEVGHYPSPSAEGRSGPLEPSKLAVARAVKAVSNKQVPNKTKKAAVLAKYKLDADERTRWRTLSTNIQRLWKELAPRKLRMVDARRIPGKDVVRCIVSIDALTEGDTVFLDMPLVPGSSEAAIRLEVLDSVKNTNEYTSKQRRY